MSGSCLDWHNPFHLDTFANIRIEIERAGRYSHWSFCCPGNIHSFFRSNYKYLAQKMVRLARAQNFDFGLLISDLKCFIDLKKLGSNLDRG